MKECTHCGGPNAPENRVCDYCGMGFSEDTIPEGSVDPREQAKLDAEAWKEANREKEIIDDQMVVRPVLMITQNGTGGDESRMIRQYEFLRSAAGEWNLIRAFFPDGPLRLEFGDGILSFQLPDSLQAVPWTSSRDLCGISLAGIPETPDQALQLISEQTKNGLSRLDP